MKSPTLDNILNVVTVADFVKLFFHHEAHEGQEFYIFLRVVLRGNKNSANVIVQSIAVDS